MREGTRTALIVKESLDERIVQQAIAAAGEAPFADRLASGLEVAIAAAESDPCAARAALLELRADHWALARLERCIGGSAKRATFGLGGAIQLALTELSLPKPDLRGRQAELERWLGGRW
jgi:hypothetical protein